MTGHKDKPMADYDVLTILLNFPNTAPILNKRPVRLYPFEAKMSMAMWSRNAPWEMYEILP